MGAVAVTAREYLSQRRILLKAIESESLILEALESSAQRVTSSFHETAVQASFIHRAMEDATSAIVEKKKTIEKLNHECRMISSEIISNVSRYGQKNAGVLLYIYINDYTLEAVGMTCGRKTRQWALNEKKSGEKLIQEAIIRRPDSFHWLDSSSKYAYLLPERKQKKV